MVQGVHVDIKSGWLFKFAPFNKASQSHGYLSNLGGVSICLFEDDGPFFIFFIEFHRLVLNKKGEPSGNSPFLIRLTVVI